MWGARSMILSLVLVAPCSARLGNTTILATVNSTGALEWERCQERFNATITKYNLSVSSGTVDRACHAIATRTASSSHGRLLQEDESIWTDIGDKLGDLDFESIKWGAEDPKTGEQNDLSTYGTLMTGTMYTVGALEAGIDGDWDSLWQGLGQSAVLFTSLIPGVGPFLSVGLSFFMSFFGGQNKIIEKVNDMLQDALEKLYSQVMTEVKTMINDARVADAITNAQILAKNCADRVYDVPTVMELFSLRDDKYDQLDDMWEWWDVTENNFGNSWRYVFGGEVNCLDQGDELVSTKDANCIAFLEKGAFIYQVNFAIAHLNVVIEMARLSVEMAGPDDKDATTQLVLSQIRTKADKYYNLLKDSLDTWKEGVQKYQYAIGCQASLDLSLFTDTEAERNYEGFVCSIKRACRGWSVQTTRALPYHPGTTFDLSCEMSCGNTSLTSNRVPEPCGNPIDGVCSEADFAKFTQAYLVSITRPYEPLLDSVKALASPLDMSSKVNELLELGKQGIQNDVDSTSPDEARRNTLYKTCLEKATESTPSSTEGTAEGQLGNGEYTIQQKVNMLYLDAHTDSDKDYSAVTRDAQDDDSQKWVITQLGNGEYTIQQKVNMQYLDAHEDAGNDYSAVTRDAQGNDSQKWVITQVGNGEYTIQQKVNMLYLDAHEDAGNDYSAVTRDAQGNDSQKWVLVNLQAPAASSFSDVCENIKTQDAASIPVSRCACRSAYCAAESSETFSSLCTSMCDVLPGTFGQ